MALKALKAHEHPLNKNVPAREHWTLRLGNLLLLNARKSKHTN